MGDYYTLELTLAFVDALKKKDIPYKEIFEYDKPGIVSLDEPNSPKEFKEHFISKIDTFSQRLSNFVDRAKDLESVSSKKD